MLLDRIVQRELAVFHQHHDSDSGYGFRHRHNLEDRIGAHRLLGFCILPSGCLEQRDLPVPRDKADGPGNLTALDELLHTRRNARQTLRIQPRRDGRLS
jgi:hypothetical protein